MSLTEFLAALPALRECYVWHEDELGMLRATCLSDDVVVCIQHSTITALAKQRTGKLYCLLLDWEGAAQVLGLSLEDSSAITSAEDGDIQHNPELARVLRQAVGIGPAADAAGAQL